MQNIKVIYIDYLCFESLFVLIKSKHKNCEVIYCQKSSTLPQAFLSYLSRKNNLIIRVIESIPSTERFIEGLNFLEKRETDLTKLINKNVDKFLENDFLTYSITLLKYNKVKLRAYLENKIYWSLYRGAELITLSESLSTKNVIILCSNPFSNILEKLSSQKIIWYKSKFSKFFDLSLRKDHEYIDENHHKPEFKRKESSGYLIFLKFTAYFVKTLLSKVHNNKINLSNHKNNIGISQYQVLLRENGANDIMWVPSRFVKSESILYLNHSILDRKSKDFLSKYDVLSVRVNPRIRELLQMTITNNNSDFYVVPSFKFYVKFFKFFYKVWRFALFNNKKTPLNSIIYYYIFRELYWRDLYSQLGLKILWSMSDGSQESLVCSQAIEKNDGFYTGSNYSFYPFETIPTQKLYDIYFTWGKYFSKNFMKRNESKESIFLDVGYVADSHFVFSANSAKKIREKFKVNYTVSYFDNNTGNDFELTESMALEMMNMFIELLEKYDYMVLLLKPKRQDEIDLYLNKFSKFKNYLDSGRIIIFLNQNPREKFAPATIGMASDLVVGLGLNTAAIECFFAGADVLYANLPKFKFKTSRFYENGAGKFIFNSIEDIKFNVDKKIKNRERHFLSNLEKDAYSDLDNFQDGKAHKRIGWALSEIQKNINTQSNRINITNFVEGLKKGINSI
jgi:hypothetical protein